MKRSQTAYDSLVYKIARTDIFITKKKICEVRAGSVKLKLVQSYELGQSYRDLKARPESFTENNT